MSSRADDLALTSPPAQRLRRPSWRDRRLLVGVALVLASVVLGALLVGRAGSTTPVYAASHPLTPGQRLSASDVHVLQVALSSAGSHYLSPRARPFDQVVLRSVPAGDLVPVSALGDADQVDVRPVSVPVDGGSIDGLRAGDVVDVWVAARATTQAGAAGSAGGGYQTPQVLARGAEVASVSRDDGVLSGAGDQSVRLLLSDDVAPDLLSAVNNEAKISLVPVPGS